MKKVDRFTNWKYPNIEEGKPTKYNWVVQNLDGLSLGTIKYSFNYNLTFDLKRSGS